MLEMKNSEVLEIDLFLHATDEEKAAVEVMRPSISYWKDAWNRLKANKAATGALVVIILVFLVSIIGPMLSPYSYEQINEGSENLAPNAQHIFGTDSLARDLFTRTMIGARISLAVGLVAAVMISIIGIIYGAISIVFGSEPITAVIAFELSDEPAAELSDELPHPTNAVTNNVSESIAANVLFIFLYPLLFLIFMIFNPLLQTNKNSYSIWFYTHSN